MTKILHDLLNAEEPLFSKSLRELEHLTAKSSVDVKLCAEILEKTASVVRSLGLDPKDTSDKELFHALNDRVRLHNENLARSIGSSDDAPVSDIVPKLVSLANTIKIPRNCWVLKKSVAKDMLRQMPPKRMMAHLGYRSLESMFKNENFLEIYTALRFSEGGEWLNEYNKQFAKNITPSDFESRQIELVVMDHDKWADVTTGFVNKKKHNITHTKELGVIVVVPMKQTHMRGLALKALPLIFHYTNEIRLYSAFFKLKSTSAHFGKVITETLIADTGTGALIANHHIHWRVIQRYFGKLGQQPPEIFQPHVQPEDLHWRKASEVLQEITPELKFWGDLDYVGRVGVDGLPVSLNLFDVSFAYSNHENFNSRYYYHMRESLWNEIFIRYMGVSVIKEQILEQLDNDMIKPESLV
jgi:hypothetical protein